jgi:hypothetical protein
MTGGKNMIGVLMLALLVLPCQIWLRPKSDADKTMHIEFFPPSVKSKHLTVNRDPLGTATRIAITVMEPEDFYDRR